MRHRPAGFDIYLVRKTVCYVNFTKTSIKVKKNVSFRPAPLLKSKLNLCGAHSVTFLSQIDKDQNPFGSFKY